MSHDGDILDHLLGEGDDRLAERARHDPDLAAELEELGAVADALRLAPAEAWDQPEVPPLPALPPVALAPDDAPGDATSNGGGIVLQLRRRVSMPRFAAAAASIALLAAGVAIGGLAFGGDGDGARQATGPAITLQAFGEGGAGASGVARPIAAGGGDLVLDVSGLAPSRDDEFYTAWLIDEAGGLQALGSFRVPEGGAASVTLPLPVALEDFALVDVSVERPDGDTGHSGRSVLRGPIGTA